MKADLDTLLDTVMRQRGGKTSPIYLIGRRVATFMSPSDQITNYLYEVSSLLYAVQRKPIQDIIIYRGYPYCLPVWPDELYNRQRWQHVSGKPLRLRSTKVDDVARKPRLKAVALTDNMALYFAWANDDSYERVFEEQLRTLLNRGDVVIGICGTDWSPTLLSRAALLSCRVP